MATMKTMVRASWMLIALLGAACAGPGGGVAPIEDRAHGGQAAAPVPGAAAVPPVARAVPLPTPQSPAAIALPEPSSPGAMEPLARAEDPYRVPPPASSAVQGLMVAALEAGERGEWDRAQAALERALKLAPDDAGVWTQLAYTHYRKGAYDQAYELAQRSLVLSAADGREDPAVWALLADIETARSNPAAAAAARAKAAGAR